MKQHLTKADFGRWIKCPTAAWYGWQGNKSKNEDDAFLNYLANEGRTVGRMAHRLFRHGRIVNEQDTKRAETVSRGLITTGDCTLFESCIIHGNFLVRPDVLVRKGDTIYIVEAKSKVGNMDAHREGRLLLNCYGNIRANYREIVSDLAFQVVVLERAYPGMMVVPYFILPEESSEGCNDEVIAARNEEVSFPLDCDDYELKRIRSESVLKFFPAASAIKTIKEQTSANMDAMADAWHKGEQPEPNLRYSCRNCEFRLNKGHCSDDGFHGCWGKFATPSPHLFELYQLYSLKTGEKRQALLADQKIALGQTSIYDIQLDELHGEHSGRQRMQLVHGRAGEEWIDPRLRDEIDALTWPVAFIDFETTMSAIPWYAGLTPYQVIPFQFSAHILYKNGKVEHREWLNTADCIPTLPFIRELKRALARAGSVLIYTDYEIRILKEAAEYLARYGSETEEERVWINDLLESGRIIDQHDWVYRYYFHPEMCGRTSIKVTLPAVWRNNPVLHQQPLFKQYYRDEGGVVIDPYETLQTQSLDGSEINVREGVGAMQAYREMLIGIGASDPEAKHKLAEMLRRYVTLDTVAQVMIFEHWRQRLGLTNTP